MFVTQHRQLTQAPESYPLPIPYPGCFVCVCGQRKGFAHRLFTCRLSRPMTARLSLHWDRWLKQGEVRRLPDPPPQCSVSCLGPQLCSPLHIAKEDHHFDLSLKSRKPWRGGSFLTNSTIYVTGMKWKALGLRSPWVEACQGGSFPDRTHHGFMLRHSTIWPMPMCPSGSGSGPVNICLTLTSGPDACL